MVDGVKSLAWSDGQRASRWPKSPTPPAVLWGCLTAVAAALVGASALLHSLPLSTCVRQIPYTLGVRVPPGPALRGNGLGAAPVPPPKALFHSPFGPYLELTLEPAGAAAALAATASSSCVMRLLVWRASVGGARVGPGEASLPLRSTGGWQVVVDLPLAHLHPVTLVEGLEPGMCKHPARARQTPTHPHPRTCVCACVCVGG
jgi:hypothetical protein